MINVLYIHGMGGGETSRIPNMLKNSLADYGVNVVVRTYSFDPGEASSQISAWVHELSPQLIMGESLGSIHAIGIKGIPHILISPALNVPLYFHFLSWLTFIPGMTWLLDRIYEPEYEGRQRPHFSYSILRKYRGHRTAALANSPACGSGDYFHAFIGLQDHYRRSGIVSIRTWKKYFGDTFSTYEGSHYTEEEYIHGLVIPLTLKLLGIKQ